MKIFAVGAMGTPKPRDPSLLLFRLRFRTEFSCKRVVHRRVSSDGGGALDSTQQQSAPSVGFCYFISYLRFAHLRLSSVCFRI